MKLDFGSRSTTDTVVLMLTLLICVVMFTICAGTIVAKALRPEMEVSRAAEAINNMLSTIVGALVGFIGGRAQGRHEERQAQLNGDQT